MSRADLLDPAVLRRSVSIFDVLAQRGLSARLRRFGIRLVGPCPVHDGDNPRAFVVHPNGRLWYCFTRCQSGGDVIDLVQRLDRASFPDALRTLASLAHGTLPHIAPDRVHALAAVFQPFTRSIPLDPRAAFLRRKGINIDTALAFETGAYVGHGFLSGCVGVRLRDPASNPIGYAGRRIAPDDVRRFGKWKFPSRIPKASLLYNYHRVSHALAQSGVTVVECPWGVMRLAQLHIPAVALLGTRLSVAQRNLLRTASHIRLMLDADPAGVAATERILADTEIASRTTIALLPPSCDPDDLNDGQLTALAAPLLS